MVIACLASAGPSEDAAQAETLFEEGQTLKNAGKLAEACAKFDELCGSTQRRRHDLERPTMRRRYQEDTRSNGSWSSRC
jgi:hypothetical protein